MKVRDSNRLSPLTAIKRRLYRKSDGEKILLDRYKTLFGHELNLSDPKTFSEKLFARMIYLNRGNYKIFTQLSDKYLVRAYVSKLAGEEFLARLYWSGDDPSKLPFKALPEKYVIKTNHGSGGNIFVEESTEKDLITSQARRWLETNYYWEDREFQYYRIHPRLLVEELLDDDNPDGPLDYRFWCFDGQPRVIQVDNRSHSINPFYTTEWKKTSLSYRERFEDTDIERPPNFEQMMTLAAKLSNGFDFVRIDLYNVRGRTIFGEMTFTPVAGRLNIQPKEWDAILGKWWEFRIY